MSHKITISNLVSLTGNGADNPPGLSIANYDLSAAELALTLTDQPVTCFDVPNNQNKQVTAKLVVDPATGRPKKGPNDIAFMPCPPFCYLQ